jgi:cytochrome c biogenesis protein CcdA
VIWRALARAVAAAHVAYVVFVVLGSVLVLIWPGLLWIHLLAVVWAGLTLMFDFGCPLTPWEKRFWLKGGVEPYEEGFLQHHVLRARFKPGTERRNHAILGALAIAFNAVIYWLVFVRR